jgi:hypothetical protein
MIAFATALGWLNTVTELTPAALKLAKELKELFTNPGEQSQLQARIDELSAQNDADHEARQKRFRDAQENG